MKMKNSSIHQQKLNSLSLQSLSTFEKAYFALTHQVLGCLKVNKISFSILLLIETIQICYFLLRTPDYWNSEVMEYVSMGISYISVDFLVKQTPNIFIIVLGVLTGILLLTIVFMLYIARKTYKRSQKQNNPFTKILISVTAWLLLIQKTVLQIPFLWIIGVSFIQGNQVSLGIIPNATQINPIIISLGVVSCLLFFLLQFFITTSFCDCNPFSDVQFTGQSTLKCGIKLAQKILLVAYILIDVDSTNQKGFIIGFTIVNVFLGMYFHAQIGYHKTFMRILALRLHYFVFWLSLCCLIASFTQNQAITTITYLIVLYFVLLFVVQLVQDRFAQNTIQKKSMFLKSDKEIEIHVLELLKLVDTLEKRESRILIEGVLSYHHRLCKLSDAECRCHKLMKIKERERNQEKAEFFHFLVDILNEGITRFPESKRIYLLLTFIYQYRQKNRFRAIYSITKTLKDLSFFDKLYFFHQIHLIEEQMKQDDNKQNVNKTVDINKFFIFNNLIVEFQKVIEFCVNQYVDFWKELLEVNINIKRLEQCGSTITRRKEEVKISFDELMDINPNNVHCLKIYGNFLSEVTNDENNYQKYLEKSDNIMKNLKESSKIDESGNKYTQNAETIIVVISGNQGQLGTVVHTNNFVQKALCYKRAELINQNVASIMPKVFGEHHNNVLNRYLSTSAQRFNGKERIVPALRKDGYMVPAVAMTKALPDLTNGIQIVGFINQLQGKLDEEEMIADVAYMLYRTDNQIIMGISKNCYTDFGIPSCLVYGNPNNSMNQLKIQHLFGTSFERDPTIYQNLTQVGISMTMDTTKLSQDFIITRDSSNELQVQQFESVEKERRRTLGVKTQVNIRTVLSLVYHEIPLRLIQFYDIAEYQTIQKSAASLSASCTKNQNEALKRQNTENEDMKDLKDFKNFISVRSEPSAIKTIRLICIAKMIIILLASAGMIVTNFLIINLHNAAVNVSTKGSISSLILPQLLYELEKPIQNRRVSIRPSVLFDQAKFQKEITTMIQMSKQNQNLLFPSRYSISPNYLENLEVFQFISNSGLYKLQTLNYEQALNLHFSKYSALKEQQNLNLIDSQTANPSKISYKEVKYNTVFSFIGKAKEINKKMIEVYGESLTFLTYFIFLISGIILVTTITWVIFCVPYALSVTKINNRVLSLFSLISEGEVYGIIIKCVNFMKQYLSEAIIFEEQEFIQRKAIIDKLEAEQDQNWKSKQLRTLKAQNSNPNSNLLKNFGLASPNQSLNASMIPSPHQSSMMMINHSQMSERHSVNQNIRKKLNKVQIKDKFDKMVNSESGDRQKVLLRYILISIIVISFTLFCLLYTYNGVFAVKKEVEIRNALNERAVAFRQLKMALQEYLIDQEGVKFNGTDLQKLSYDKINQSYTIERKLIQFEFGDFYEEQLFYYNTNNLCEKIEDFKNYSIKGQVFSKSQCLSIGQGTLTKGVKTTIVKILQETRSTLSIPLKSLNRKEKLLQIVKYNILQKYLESSMFHISNSIKHQINSSEDQNNLILIIVCAVFVIGMAAFWWIFWKKYIEELNMQILRTKGMLNIIPMRIISNNEVLKNQFTSGQLQQAVR